MEKQTKKQGTTIKVSNQVWLNLNKRKRAGESFDSVISRALLELEENK